MKVYFSEAVTLGNQEYPMQEGGDNSRDDKAEIHEAIPEQQVGPTQE